MTSKAVLRRFWLKFDDDVYSPMGYGVTAWTEDDAISILKSLVFRDQPVPKAKITADVDFSALDPGHIGPNMGSPNWRGIWYPLGFGDNEERRG
jgi:hypothetical protein